MLIKKNKNKRIKHTLCMTYISAFIPKAKILHFMAGLLTYSTFSNLPIQH